MTYIQLIHYIHYGLASAAIFTVGIIVGIAAMAYVQPMIKNKVLSGFVLLAVAVCVGWALSWIVGHALTLRP